MGRDKSWTTHLGNEVSIEGAEDSHIANTIQFLVHYKHPDKKMLKELKQEAKFRGLNKEYLDRAPFPYKDGLGNWIVWDYKTDKPKEIGRYAK